MYETSKLRGRIVEKFGSQIAFSKHVGCSLSSLSLYLNGKKALNQSTIDAWVEALGIPAEEIADYFFTRKVDNRKAE